MSHEAMEEDRQIVVSRAVDGHYKTNDPMVLRRIHVELFGCTLDEDNDFCRETMSAIWKAMGNGAFGHTGLRTHDDRGYARPDVHVLLDLIAGVKEVSGAIVYQTLELAFGEDLASRFFVAALKAQIFVVGEGANPFRPRTPTEVEPDDTSKAFLLWSAADAPEKLKQHWDGDPRRLLWVFSNPVGRDDLDFEEYPAWLIDRCPDASYHCVTVDGTGVRFIFRVAPWGDGLGGPKL